MIYAARIISVFFGLIVISRTYVDFKSREESRTMFVFWLMVWVGVMAIAMTYPNSTNKLMVLMGAKSGVGTLLGIGIVFLLYITYRIYVKANRIEKKLNELVKRIALEELK